MKTLAWLLIPCLVAGLGAVAPPTPDASLLVRQLGADTLAERERADRRLQGVGKSAVPALRDGAKGRDAEVRRRCVRLLARIERAAMEPRLAALLAGQDAFSPPLPAWEKLREIVGGDLGSRLLYVQVYKASLPLLEWMERGSDSNEFMRWGHIWGRSLADLHEKAARGDGGGELALVLFKAALAQKDDRASYYIVHPLLDRYAVKCRLSTDPAFRRLVMRFFAGPGAEAFALYTSAGRTRELGLEDVRHDTLEPAALRLLDEVFEAKPDFEKLSWVAAAIEELAIREEVPERVREALRKRAREAAAKPFDKRLTPEIVSTLQHLGMHKTLTDVFGPVALRLIRRLDGELFSREQFDEIHRLCQSIDSAELTETLTLAGCKLLTTVGTKGDKFRSLVEAVELAKYLDLQEALEGLLIPVVRKELLAALERTTDLDPLTKASELALQVKLDGVADLVKPALLLHAKSLRSTTADVSEVYRVYSLARSLRAKDVIDEQIEPVVRKTLVAALGEGVEETVAGSCLWLARELRLEEGVELGIKAAADRKYSAHVRADAALTVGWLGTPAQAKRLAPRLDDLSDVGYKVNDGVGMRTVLVCDVALAALLACEKQDLRDYGFGEGATFSGDNEYGKVGGFGFRTHEARTGAIARWKKWSAAQKK